MKKNNIAIFLTGFFMLLGIIFISYFYNLTSKLKKDVLPVIGEEQAHHVASFSFVNQDGKTITNDDVKGKICVVEYFFTTCKGICPKMNENMQQVYKAYLGNDRVVILSHTVDPIRDSVKAMKEYSLRFGADAKKWMFLTGDKKQLYDMARYSYLISAQDDTVGVSVDQDFIHDKQYSLVDGYGRIRGFYDGLDQKSIDKLISDINLLLKESN
jgi:protein SCO1/2